MHAVRETERLGIELILGSGPGWNGSGGPWVKGADSMQHLVASTIKAQGPSRFSWGNSLFQNRANRFSIVSRRN